MKKKQPQKQQKQQNIISQSKAASIAGVSRQALNIMFKKNNGNYNFFTAQGKVDIGNPDWESYLQDKTHKGQKGQGSKQGSKSAKNNLQGVERRKTGQKSGKEKVIEMREEAGRGWEREHALTGGFNPAGFYPENPGQLKSLTDVTRMNLEMRIRLGGFVERAIVDTYIDKVAQGIMQFVNLKRSVSSPICQKLDRMGMEKEVEKIIGPKVANIIEQIIGTCNKISGKEYGEAEVKKGKKRKAVKKKAIKKKAATKIKNKKAVKKDG